LVALVHQEPLPLTSEHALQGYEIHHVCAAHLAATDSLQEQAAATLALTLPTQNLAVTKF
jgi:hypothetical protein